MADGHVLVVDQIDSDVLSRLKDELTRLAVRLALCGRGQKSHRNLHLGLCIIAQGQRDGGISQVQVKCSLADGGLANLGTIRAVHWHPCLQVSALCELPAL